MPRQALNPDTVHRTFAPYSHAVRAGDFLFISGQSAVALDGSFVGGDDVREQARQVYRNMRAVVEAAGGTLDDIVMMNAFMTDPKDRLAAGEVRREFFTGDYPALTLCFINQLAFPEWKIEVEAVAYLPEKRES